MAEDRAQPAVDLVVATVSRRLELERFLESVASQSYRNVRVIVVDQNDDDRLDPVLERLQGNLSILRLRSARGRGCC